MLVVADIDNKSDCGKDMIYNTTWNAEENDNVYDFEVVLMTQTGMVKIANGDDNHCDWVSFY